MSEKALKRILVGLGILVAAYAAAALVRSPVATGPDSADGLARLLSGIDSAAVEEVVFRRPANSVTLTRGDDGWRVNGHRADSSRVASLFSSVAEENAGRVVATNPANHGRLGVSEDSAVRAVFRQESGDSTALLVGASGSSWPSVYVRAEGDDAVFLLRGDLRTAARRSVQDWRDKRIARVDTAAASVVEVTRGGSAYTLERRESGWTMGGEAVGASAVRDLLSELARMDATGFAPADAGMPEPDRRILVRDGGGGVLVELLVAETEGSSVLVQRAEGGPVYRFPAYRADRLTPEPDVVRGQDEPGAE